MNQILKTLATMALVVGAFSHVRQEALVRAGVLDGQGRGAQSMATPGEDRLADSYLHEHDIAPDQEPAWLVSIA